MNSKYKILLAVLLLVLVPGLDVGAGIADRG